MFNPLNLFRPIDPAAAAKRAETLKQGGPRFVGQVGEMIGTFGTAFSRLLASIGAVPPAVVGGTSTAIHRGIDVVGYPFGLVGKIMNSTQRKIYGLLGQEWGPGWSGRVKAAVSAP
ncbi:MAG: hypothetical protein Q7S29_02390 [Candidatus Peribacter sp.]|nr:hypothetical protein [Candidatus Peribacter sp.]